jgi:serine/threonine protein kinase
MDLCTGGNLLDYMKRHPVHQNAEGMAKGFLRQMLYAVKYMHEHQIVHRSVVPDTYVPYTRDPV